MSSISQNTIYSKGSGLSRREAISYVSRALGVASTSTLLSSLSVSTALAYTPKKNSENKNGLLFKQGDMLTLKFIGDTVLPKTETASASELDVHGFVDNQLFQCYTPEDQKKVLDVVADINKVTIKRHKQPFFALNSQDQTQLLVDLENEHQHFSESAPENFKLLKELILTGYFTSEYGASTVLEYLAIPGGFQGSVHYTTPPRGEGNLGRF